MISGELHRARVLILDDEPTNTALPEARLRRWGFSELVISNHSNRVVETAPRSGYRNGVHPAELVSRG